MKAALDTQKKINSADDNTKKNKKLKKEKKTSLLEMQRIQRCGSVFSVQ